MSEREEEKQRAINRMEWLSALAWSAVAILLVANIFGGDGIVCRAITALGIALWCYPIHLTGRIHTRIENLRKQ